MENGRYSLRQIIIEVKTKKSKKGSGYKIYKTATISDENDVVLSQFKEKTFKDLSSQIRKKFNIPPNITINKEGKTIALARN